MYKTCPKCGYTRTHADVASQAQCSACGLIFKKWMQQQFQKSPAEVVESERSGTGVMEKLGGIFLHTKPEQEPFSFYLRAALLLGLIIWGWSFITMDYYRIVNGYRVDYAQAEIYGSFMHNVNLVFHEAGHVIFRPFGRFMTILGGSLAQLLMPLIVVLVFLLKERNTFAASVGLWWLGQSFMDVAPYINDARAGQIPLLGGGTGADRPGMHDWKNILGDLGLLHRDHDIAAIADNIGIGLMLLSFIWGAFLIYIQYQNLRKR